MISFTNLNDFIAGVDKRISQIEQNFERTYAVVLSSMFNQIVLESPQYTGNFAANWKLSIEGRTSGGTYREYFDRDAYKTNPKFRGNVDALYFARANAQLDQLRIPLTAKARFHNPTPYAEIIAANQPAFGRTTFLRPGNYVDPSPIPLGSVIKSFPQIVKYSKRITQ